MGQSRWVAAGLRRCRFSCVGLRGPIHGRTGQRSVRSGSPSVKLILDPRGYWAVEKHDIIGQNETPRQNRGDRHKMVDKPICLRPNVLRHPTY